MEPPPSPTSLAPLILRHLLIPLLIYIDNSLLILTRRFKFFQILRYFLITAFLFFLKIIPSFIPNSLNLNHHHHKDNFNYCYDSNSFQGSGKSNDSDHVPATGDSCIARALTQLLAIINEIPVSSRKYEIVRSYAEKLMNENLEEGFEPLRKVNTTVLSAAFSRALGQLESAVKAGPPAEDGGEIIRGRDAVRRGGYFGLRRMIKRVGYFGDAAWTRFGRPEGQLVQLHGSAEKLSAELLWLAEKLSACGSVEEAVCRWAAASNLASVALSAQPRLQGSLVKLSALLFKEARYMGGEDGEEKTMEELRKTKMKMLMSWLPFLCRASVGTDAPVLSFIEKSELERVLGELIVSLTHEEEQEKVLSLWLHHFTHCSSSDWPNLHPYYAQWCNVSRKLLILEGK